MMPANFYKTHILLIVFLFSSFLTLFSQNAHETSLVNVQDTIYADQDTIPKAVRDSMMIEDLRLQVQGLKLNEILLRNEYDRTTKLSAEADSIKKAKQKAQIDSLRNHTQGMPLIIDKDTLLTLYAKRGGLPPRERVRRAQEVIEDLGRRLTMGVDSVYVLDSDYATDIMSGETVILTFTDQDGLWQNMTRQELAESYVSVIYSKICEMHSEYGLMVKIKGVLLSLLVIAIQIALIYLTNWLFRKLRRRIVMIMRTKLTPIKIKDYEFLDVHKQGRVLLFFSNVGRLLIILVQLLISIPILFSIFPETKDLAYTLFSYIFNPVKDIFIKFLKYLPNLFYIIIIFYCVRYVNKGLRYVANEIASGRLRISGFYDDWAFPTYYILRFLLYSFMVVLIWPLLPNSQSAVFQGVSVFVGLVFSLGSTTVIGNLMAGMVLTYMRSFKIGDQIKLGDVMGVVVEKTPFVTRIRTSMDELVTIPNSTVMSSQTVNYSMSIDRQRGVSIGVDVGVGYDVDKEKVKELLVEAANSAEGILAKPKPVVFVTKLEEFYCCYQICVYTRDVKTLGRVYSNLNEAILEKFNEAGVELLLPHFMAPRKGRSDAAMPDLSDEI